MLFRSVECYTQEVIQKHDEGYRVRESAAGGGIAETNMMSLDFTSRVWEGGSLEVIGSIARKRGAVNSQTS